MQGSGAYLIKVGGSITDFLTELSIIFKILNENQSFNSKTRQWEQ